MRFGWMAAMAATLLVPGIAHAEDWVVVSVTDDGSGAMLIDADAMSTGGSVRKVRLFGVLREDQGALAGALGEMSFDCEARTRRADVLWSYDRDGKVVGPSEHETDWSPVIPGTIFNIVIKAACGEVPLDGRRFGAGFPLHKGRQMLIERGRKSAGQ